MDEQESDPNNLIDLVSLRYKWSPPTFEKCYKYQKDVIILKSKFQYFSVLHILSIP